MATLKTFTLYSHAGGPNPWKVAIILEELGLPYEHKFLDFKQVKEEPFISLNPNGRVPAIEDPNTGISLWESGAIIDYLIDTYDTAHKLQYTSTREKYQTRVWEHFQMSGQGPYFGQLIWFKRYHPEKVQSAVDRYAKEIRRVTGVIDSHLRKQKTEYLVGDRLTYADLMFVPWAVAVSSLAGDSLDLSGFDAYDAWLRKLTSRPSAAKIIKEREAAMAAQQ
ncbi:glutathione-s-transferase theta, gst [Metarhizium rileyi]|uniref:glutathione transferase n=1 Tax=Metarhizium rileyi (strain RCEF 4871) TaxID=1649241 RepID=A0A167FLT8_METRR|nr:glutathione-s-transferase theta, gst [Metarhizium rileyi RCEF 4871]TWU78326.1 glutathione S- transferase, nitrogen catabolite repression regulator [Metarhizium rileyi]